jgi:putative NADH-flavin reductase
MKKIALFGASGKTGQQFLDQALEKGYTIKALVRNPDKISQKSSLLELVKGDVLDFDTVNKTIQDCDLVVSLFGHVKGSPEWLQTDGTENIIKAMKQNGLTKIISLSGGGLPFPEKDQPKFPDKMIRFIMKLAVPKVLNDAIRHAEVLKNSGLDWVIVRGPRLTDGEKKGDYRIGWVGVNASPSISRADLADFIVVLVESTDYDLQMPFVSY